MLQPGDRVLAIDGTPLDQVQVSARDWYFIAEQPALAPHLAHPEGCAVPRIVLVTVPRVSRSCEHFSDGFDLHTLLVSATGRRWSSNLSGKCSYERPTRGTVCGTMRSMCGADAGCLAINYQSLYQPQAGDRVLAIDGTPLDHVQVSPISCLGSTYNLYNYHP